MPTYLYCLLLPERAVEPRPVTVTGIGGAAVRVLSAGALEAWVSTIPTSPPAASVESAREHDAVVSAALATHRTPLPARFGQIWSSDDACSIAMAERAADFEAQLHRIAGLVEMTVYSVSPTMPPADAARSTRAASTTPGTAYLERLRARSDREEDLDAALEALRARVTRALASVPRGEMPELRGRGEARALSVSYLIEPSDEAQFRRAVDAVARELGVRLVVAGPRAPYSFAAAIRERVQTSGSADRAGR